MKKSLVALAFGTMGLGIGRIRHDERPFGRGQGA